MNLGGHLFGGWSGIRTHETLSRLPVFKTGPFNRSGTHPHLILLPFSAQHFGEKGRKVTKGSHNTNNPDQCSPLVRSFIARRSAVSTIRAASSCIVLVTWL